MTAPLIKICGLSTPETIEASLDAGASHIGFVHFEPSSRHLSLDEAARLRQCVPPDRRAVLLLANADPHTTATAIDRIRPDVVQFHGRETPEWVGLVRQQAKVEVWKAVGLREPATLKRAGKWKGKVDRLLYDAPAKALPGGNGEAFDWNWLSDFDHEIEWGLAGGLTPENVGRAIRTTGAPLVDTSSGVESAPGVKDVDLIRSFCKAALQS